MSIEVKELEKHSSFVVDLQFSVKTVFSEEQIRDLRELAQLGKKVVNSSRKYLKEVAKSDATDNEFLIAFQRLLFREAIKQVIQDEIIDGNLVKNLSPVQVTVSPRK